MDTYRSARKSTPSGRLAGEAEWNQRLTSCYLAPSNSSATTAKTPSANITPSKQYAPLRGITRKVSDEPICQTQPRRTNPPRLAGWRTNEQHARLIRCTDRVRCEQPKGKYATRHQCPHDDDARGRMPSAHRSYNRPQKARTRSRV